MNWKGFTPAHALAGLAASFLTIGSLMLVAPLTDFRSCLFDDPGRTFSLAKMFIVLGTASVGFLAYLKR